MRVLTGYRDGGIMGTLKLCDKDRWSDDIMNEILRAGIKKKSFELKFNGGTIRCEHLDGMGYVEETDISEEGW